MPDFLTVDCSPLGAHGFVEPGMALARFLPLHSDLKQTCESSFSSQLLVNVMNQKAIQ
jgi:hypothetical protein